MGFVLHSLSETGHDWCGRPRVGIFQSRPNRQQALRLLRSNWRNLILRLGRLSLIGELISGYKPICYMSAENSSKIVILVKEQAEAEMKQELDASVADASQHYALVQHNSYRVVDVHHVCYYSLHSTTFTDT